MFLILTLTSLMGSLKKHMVFQTNVTFDYVTNN